MNEDTDQGIFSRKMVFCPFLRDRFDFPDDILVHCSECLRFVAVCCSDYKAGKRCHHWQLVYTDGACLSNGQRGATAGIGVAIGLGDLGLHQWSIPIDDTVDAYPTRSSQRAELLAAIEGLRLISEANSERLDDHTTPRGAKKPFAIVITTDSEYVVKGMTEWFPAWKENGWRKSTGQRPGNLDLFQKLDTQIIALEGARHVKVGFWHVPRRFNTVADGLAKRAAQGAPAASPA